ncbi:GAF domain-containing protein, involved in signal transduction [hydrothermal vent metagenome]|uniref:GAF domain-containing protein, involved in signal transduction n=1 Tax=hydrothermal vent metagenome TaxID=652676 RepID=A0A3B0UQ74_9ZZZZ
MAEELNILKNISKEQKYQELLPQIEALISDEPDLIANMANVAAVIKTATNYLWAGFYLVKGEELVLGPFQGSIACARIKKGNGVCGVAWLSQETQIVPDVDAFPGHIACSGDSKSEIVVPGIKNGKVQFILDVDSSTINELDATDARFFEQIVELL